MNLAQALFARHSGEITPPVFGGVSVGGKMGTIAMAKVARSTISTHNPLTMADCPKASTPLTFFEIVNTQPNMIAVYKSMSTDLVYMEIAGVGFGSTLTTLYLPKGGTGIQRRHMLIPTLLAYCQTDTEGKECLAAIINGLAAKADVLEVGAKLADSFYYGFCKGKVDLPEEEINLEQIKAMFRSGDMQPLFAGKQSGFVFGTSELDKEKAPAPKVSKAASEDFMARCLNREFFINYDWDPAVKDAIPSLDRLRAFAYSENFEDLVRVLHQVFSRNIERMEMGLEGAEAIQHEIMQALLQGTPGTGKTAIAYAVASALHVPVTTVVWSKNSEEGTLTGQNAIIEGKLQFAETPGLKFHKFGGIEIWEEINLADQAMLTGIANQKLEFPYVLLVNGITAVTRHPMNFVIGTMNLGTNGSRPLNESLNSRFSLSMTINRPNKDVLLDAIVRATGSDKPHAEWALKVLEIITNYLKNPSVGEENVADNLSIRQCIACLNLISYGIPWVRSVKNSFISVINTFANSVELGPAVELDCLKLIPAPTW